jgi:hypothetical protein
MPETVPPPAEQLPASTHTSSRQSPLALKATKQIDRTWTDDEDGLANLALDNELFDIPLEDLRGAQARTKDDRFAIPFVLDYSASTRTTSYRRGEMLVALPAGTTPPDSSWIEIDPRMTLKRAFELYGEELLGFEKVVRRISLEILLVARQRREQVLRVLIRRPARPRWTPSSHDQHPEE